jgi:hypothetical protein
MCLCHSRLTMPANGAERCAPHAAPPPRQYQIRIRVEPPPYDPRVPRGRTSSLVLHRSVLPLYVAHLLLRVLSCCLFLLVEPAVEGAPSSWSASGQRRHAKHSRRPLINDEVLPPPPKPWRSSICYSDPSGQGSQAEDIFWK